MSIENYKMIRMLANNFVGPVEYAVARTKLQRQYQPLDFSSAKCIESILHPSFFCKSTKSRQILHLLHRKILVVQTCVSHIRKLAGHASHIMVTNRKHIRQLSFKPRECILNDLPFLVTVVLREIALLQNE